MRTIPGVIAAALMVLTVSTAAAVPAQLEPLRFLLGEWPSTGGGKPGQGTGTAVFSSSLQDRVMLRTNYAEYPATGDKPKSRHDDLMVIYEAASGVRADYYDSEGHVIHYAVSSPAPNEAVFVSDAAAGQPKFRLSYKLDAAGLLKGTFEIASPDAPDTFKPYLSWESRKGRGGK